jgi:hypothetical protein
LKKGDGPKKDEGYIKADREAENDAEGDGPLRGARSHAKNGTCTSEWVTVLKGAVYLYTLCCLCKLQRLGGHLCERFCTIQQFITVSTTLV